MGNLLFYEGDGRIAGEISTAHWRQMRRILPMLIEWLNEAMLQRMKTQPPETLVPGPFKLTSLLIDESDKKEEINLKGLKELNRFFAWFDWLATVDDTAKFFAPVIQALREQSRHPDVLRS